jgi:hypothetical protein
MALRRSLVVLLLTMIVAGCSSQSMPALPTVYPVKGKVVQADGQPLSYGRVHLTPRERGKGQPCNGFLNSDGSFDKLMTYAGGFGAVPGKYLMHIEPDTKNEKGFYSGKSKEMPVPPEKYRDPQTAELAVEIKAGDNDLGTITLK